MDEKILNYIISIANRDVIEYPMDYDYDDSYLYGFRDGRTSLAREILEILNKNENKEEKDQFPF